MGEQIERAGHGLVIDEIRIGATWADVAPVVPKPATLATPGGGSEYH